MEKNICQKLRKKVIMHMNKLLLQMKTLIYIQKLIQQFKIEPKSWENHKNISLILLET